MSNKNENLRESETSKNSTSDEDDPKTPENAVTDYEKQRLTRIAENKARMEALGLHKISNSLLGSAQSRKAKPKSKRVVKKDEKDDDDDDDYEPNDEDNDGGLSSSSEELEEESHSGRKSRSRSNKLKKSMFNKQISTKQSMEMPENMDEDEALAQAIALSLKDFEESSDLQHRRPFQGSNAKSPSCNKKGHGQIQEDNTRRKKRKSFSSRAQMTNDELVIHFCQIDEAGKGSITLRDLERMAATHDFTWTDKELADMIRCFDSDRDGKLTLDDFRNIVQRCNLLQGLENP